MIYYKTNDDYEITVSGHANYGKKGEDIVCSSVSTAIILTSNLIKRYNELDLVEIKLEEGYFKVKPKKLTNNIKVLLDNLIWTLNELKDQYPKYITKE